MFVKISKNLHVCTWFIWDHNKLPTSNHYGCYDRPLGVQIYLQQLKVPPSDLNLMSVLDSLEQL